ncbi:DUF3060 domain-containing protein [bacterium]|nr:DUF3060 domain-containing protein [bacterium]
MKKLLMAVLLLTLPGWCETHSLVLTGQNQVIKVRAGDHIDLVGDSNQITIQGDCAHLNLTGSGNHFRLEGQLDSVNVVGSDNEMNWVQLQNRHAPNLQSIGSNNRVLPVSP